MYETGIVVSYPDGTKALYPDLVFSSSVVDKRDYVIKEEDTIFSIAIRELGATKRWTDIILLNPSLDALELIPGNTIKLPIYG